MIAAYSIPALAGVLAAAVSIFILSIIALYRAP